MNNAGEIRFNSDVIVGGINENAPEDTIGPEIQLFMNDESFLDGANTNASPNLIAKLADLSGINTSVTAVDHDIVGILDGDESNPIILNDFYQTELDDFTRGKVVYRLRNLSVGPHTLKLKAWDTYNNSSEAMLNFVVVSDNSVTLDNVLNYPNPFVNYTEFWFNHFNVYQQKGSVRPFAGHYAINVARAHALGKFEDLVLASAKHPAMLYYLDQWLSVSPQAARAGQNARGLNENYARELMELHTLGVNGGYTQGDVLELARVLTGWTISPRSADGFQFVMRLHESGSKSVMGQTVPTSAQNTGVQEGEQLIRYLANHPATAQRISERLAQYFVSDNPPKALVDLMAQTFLNTRGDIYQVMSVMLGHTAFWDPANKLYRTPYDFACASMRVLNAGQDRTKWLQSFGYAAVAGQAIQNWQTPDGYSFNASTWLTPEALTRRIDFALNIARNSSERTDLYPYLSESTLKALMSQMPVQRMGFVLGSSELVFK